MPGWSPCTIKLSSAEEVELHRRASKYTLPYFQVQRAKMILYAAQGMSNHEIANCLDTRRESGLALAQALPYRPPRWVRRTGSTGSPPDFSPQNSSYKLRPLPASCRRSTTCLSRWSTHDLVEQVQHSGLVASLSGSTLWRWLQEGAIRPWYHRSWIFPRDPQFATKAGRVLDLYASQWKARP
jgi:hypothetical protein